MPFNFTLFVTIIAWIWGIAAVCNVVNIWVASTEKEKLTSLLSALIMFAVLGACLVL
jgi:hypothetical protein